MGPSGSPFFASCARRSAQWQPQRAQTRSGSSRRPLLSASLSTFVFTLSFQYRTGQRTRGYREQFTQACVRPVCTSDHLVPFLYSIKKSRNAAAAAHPARQRQFATKYRNSIHAERTLGSSSRISLANSMSSSLRQSVSC